MTFKKWVAGTVACAWLLAGSLPVFALTTISSNTTWTDTGGGITLNDSLRIDSGATLRIISSGGVNGGDLTINLPNSGTQYLLVSGILDLSAMSNGGRGGNLIINALGNNTTYTYVNGGLIRSNGLGSGAGGTITSNVRYNYIYNGAIEAMGGASGYGGVIDLNSAPAGGSSLTYLVGASSELNTSGYTSATSNLITIESDVIYNEGQIIANGYSGSRGGTIQMVAKNGRIVIENTGDIVALGNGAGAGGTVEIAAGLGGDTLNIANCNNCDINDDELIQIHNNARINVAGGSADSGIVRIGRSTSGSINQDMDNFRNNQIQGAGEVAFGDDGGNTTSLTIRDYNNGSDFDGTDPTVKLVSNGAVTAINGNDFGTVDVEANGLVYLVETGDIDIKSFTNNSTSDSIIYSYNGSVVGKKNSDTDVTSNGNVYVVAGDRSNDRDSYIFLNMDVERNAALYAAGMIDDGNNAYDTANSILVSGDVDGDLSLLNISGGATVGDIYMGTGHGDMNVGGNTNFNTAMNVTGNGSWDGTVAGTAGENIYFYAKSGDFTSAGITANGSVGNKWFAYRNLAIYTPKGSILGSGYTSNNAAGGMRLKAGDYNNLDPNLHINVSNLHSDGFTDFVASGDSNGDGTGNSINVTGSFHSQGAIWATGLNNKNMADYATGRINITATTGDLTTGLVMGKGGSINLTAGNGSIKEDKVRGFNPASTIMAANNTTVTLTATGNNFSNVNTSVTTLGAGGDLIVRVDGDTNGNGSGSSVEIEGEVEGSVTVTDTSGGAPTGSVSTP